VTDEQRERALSLFYDEGKTLGEIAETLNLPRGIYDLSPWSYSTHMREQMRQEGRWKPNAEDLAWHLKHL
jgi:hypothetical protein